MERHYGLPVAFAAAAHAALLFAFDKPPRAATPKSPDIIRVDCVFPLPEVEPVVEQDPQPAETVAKAAPDTPIPTQAEPLVLHVSNPFMITPPPVHTVSTGDLKHVLERSIGVPGGDGPPAWGKDILSGIHLDNAPRTRFQAAPHYPFEGTQGGLHGEVVVEFVVDEQGRVHDPRVMSSTHRMFEEPTLRAVSKWVFEPGRRAGRIVSFKMAVPVVFKLNE
jgi:periplasmic protein TonB